jgi:hypothetical protein
VQQRGREKFQTAQQKYLATIEALETDLQDAGQLQGLITLREEKKRFEQDKTTISPRVPSLPNRKACGRFKPPRTAVCRPIAASRHCKP